MHPTLCLAVVASLICGRICATAAPAGAESATVGPTHGSLVIVGGGARDGAILERFVELAGGPDALIVVVPTAGEAESYTTHWSGLKSLRAAGARNLVLLHTRDRAVADSDGFIAPLTQARGVWFGGGRQWRLVDAYLNSRTQRAFEEVLRRGGVIGGSSAGATIQGSYLVRGAREGNRIMMAPGYEKGFGYLRHVAIDQHLLTRKRENDLLEVIDRHPHLLGIGIDENTAIVVQGDRFEVIGASKVAIYDPNRQPDGDEARYFFLNPGDRFNLRTRQRDAPDRP